MSIVAIDAGTTSVRAAVFDENARLIREARRDCAPRAPATGLVEFDATSLGRATIDAVLEVIGDGAPVSSIGVTNQRSSTVVWDRNTGKPVGPGIGWQDLRTATRCSELSLDGVPVAANQSPTKAEWLWDQHDPGRTKDLCVGTIDSWLIWVLSDGAAHVTDASNAHASGFMTADGSGWNVEVAEATNIPISGLGSIVDSIGPVVMASVIPGNPQITAIVGDQQASMFGHGCTSDGDMKATFGTGGSLNLCLGNERRGSRTGSFPIIARRQVGATVWGLEAIMLSAGSCMSWLVDLGVIDSPEQSSAVAAECTDSGDVWFVPALAGLGSPYWDMSATGTLLGVTRGTTRAQVVRAVLEGIAHRGADLLECVDDPQPDHEQANESAARPLPIDGGMSTNPVFVQALANTTQRVIELASTVEQTLVGVAMMAAVGADLMEVASQNAVDEPVRRPARGIVEPLTTTDRDRWRSAVDRARSR